MSSLGLMFVGSVLFINGLSLLGRVDAKAAAPINAFIGTLLVGVTLFINVPLAGETADTTDLVLGSAGYLLFALTYLYVAIANWSGSGGSGLGWYCAWAAVVSLFLSIVYFARFEDAKFGAIWLSWALLFTAFFLVLALEREELRTATGWLTVLQAFTTTTIPGALLLVGAWDELNAAVVVAAQAAVALAFFALAGRPLRRLAWPIGHSPILSSPGTEQGSHR